MERLGFALLTAGFLIGSFLASLDPSEVNWGLFVPAVAAGAVGVVLIKRARSAVARDRSVLEGNLEVLDRSLSSLAVNLDRFRRRSTELPGHALRFEIDKHFRDDLRAFAGARESMIHLFGLRSYGEVMSAFAAGERYINRIWSASADGYEDEARAYIERAHTQVSEARAAFDRARSIAQSGVERSA